MKNKKLYRASFYAGAEIVNTFDLEAYNKKEVEERIKDFGFNTKNWDIDKIA